MFEILVLLLVVGGLVLLVGPRIMGRRGPGGSRGPGGLGGPGGRGGQYAPGTLLVTGVSAGAASDGSQFVTITGVINGPTVREHEVYGRLQMAVGTAPSMGQLIPVVYSTKNPEKWSFAPSDAPEPHAPPPPPGPPAPPPGPTELR
ncbi:hypothetical protein H7J06_10125 [Mycobacterium hodleri]|uniref:hypothetical protein n=1 Tax=Mycolicibacterium hodleri TaxID=49897 RepID=UPI0021F3288D|nr:hypothetical protein [Mycolicibacterium hodleri]MCV7133340.1 hypothetical protein [Mycolicibacterium hodleri]